jgi:hypothetical protein
MNVRPIRTGGVDLSTVTLAHHISTTVGEVEQVFDPFAIVKAPATVLRTKSPLPSRGRIWRS